jgi:hypothetical protein
VPRARGKSPRAVTNAVIRIGISRAKTVRRVDKDSVAFELAFENFDLYFEETDMGITPGERTPHRA